MIPKPTIGRIVTYTITAQDAARINDQRARSEGKLHGNTAHEGEQYPLIVTRTWPSETYPPNGAVNGQVWLDGNDTLWVTSVKENEGGTDAAPQPGTWQWPVKG